MRIDVVARARRRRRDALPTGSCAGRPALVARHPKIGRSIIIGPMDVWMDGWMDGTECLPIK